jgi:hypothetical protein
MKYDHSSQVDHFLDNSDVKWDQPVSVNESSSDSETEGGVERRSRSKALTSERPMSIPHSKTISFKDAELLRNTSGSFGGAVCKREFDCG